MVIFHSYVKLPEGIGVYHMTPTQKRPSQFAEPLGHHSSPEGSRRSPWSKTSWDDHQVRPTANIATVAVAQKHGWNIVNAWDIPSWSWSNFGHFFCLECRVSMVFKLLVTTLNSSDVLRHQWAWSCNPKIWCSIHGTDGTKTAEHNHNPWNKISST